ncbi:hypothetical protein GBA52_021928 [Prunus armeniaca]|nr:hypothetical protein GBA52_021928 [Prunus armeniaca]
MSDDDYNEMDMRYRNQIRHEIEIFHDIGNPNVVKCHSIFDHNGEIQVLFKFMDGSSLECQRREREGWRGEEMGTEKVTLRGSTWTVDCLVFAW